jgi:hypothetical protein
MQEMVVWTEACGATRVAAAYESEGVRVCTEGILGCWLGAQYRSGGSSLPACVAVAWCEMYLGQTEQVGHTVCTAVLYV